MGRDQTPHIGLYGVMNVGKSSLLNRLTGQQTSIVSPEAGTTTDPVRRSFEIAGFGPVVFIDTAGIDDTASELGRSRVRKTLQTLSEIDLAVVLLADNDPSTAEQELLDTIQANDIPAMVLPRRGDGVATDEILQRIGQRLPDAATADEPPFFGDRQIEAGDRIVFVCPIDSAAPAGRLILPQVQALRAALDRGAVAVAAQPAELPLVLRTTTDIRLIVTDSQAFREVSAIAHELSPTTEVTSFSILLAEHKGDRTLYAEGLRAVDTLRHGDRILVIENCSHQTTCDDIGRTKIPTWLREYTGLDDLQFVFVNGRDPLPPELHTSAGYFSLAVQCGGCVATRRTIQARIRAAAQNGVPITNYGMLIRKLRLR
ncbi:MAG: 50S ribosome-binding GTPase [Rikenella sp.]|nr:50S ribosome-binding GTPase [Rikenella sp.]